MNTKAVADAVAQATGLTKAQATEAVNAALAEIVRGVASGEKVTLAGFGTFESRHRNAREGRNPQTGDTVQIAAADVPGFRPASAFKEAVNKG